MPWVSCRCSLYTFLFVLPTVVSIAELIGICQYKNFWRKKAFYNGYYGLFGCAMLVATWFQISIVKWCLFVRKAVNIRERRVQQLLHRLEQEDAINLFRQANRVSSRIA